MNPYYPYYYTNSTSLDPNEGAKIVRLFTEMHALKSENSLPFWSHSSLLICKDWMREVAFDEGQPILKCVFLVYGQ